jgi:hypothetical protein
MRRGGIFAIAALAQTFAGEECNLSTEDLDVDMLDAANFLTLVPKPAASALGLVAIGVLGMLARKRS